MLAMRLRQHWIRLLATCGFLAIGCEGIGTMTPGKMEWVRPDSQRPRVGNVYLLRAFIGLWSGGVNELARKLNEQGVRACVFQQEQADELARIIIDRYKGAKDREPLCLMGHSFGANDAVRIAQRLNAEGITVDLLVTFDATSPPPLPPNVKLCYNFYQPSVWDATPFLRGIPMTQESPSAGKLLNCDVRGNRQDLLEANTNHVNIAGNPKIHRLIIDEVLSLCPVRQPESMPD